MKIFLVKKEDLVIVGETPLVSIGEIKAFEEIVTEPNQRSNYLQITGKFETVDKYFVEEKRGIIPPKFLRKNRF